jgi:hypothetical protein
MRVLGFVKIECGHTRGAITPRIAHAASGFVVEGGQAEAEVSWLIQHC